MPGKCPKCGSRILKRTSTNGYTYYACERRECGFMTWDVPVKDNCPECGHTLFKKSGRGFNKPFCINENCSRFVPEDQRGYRRRSADKAEQDGTPQAGTEAEAAPKPAAKKPAAKKPAAKKTEAKKPAAKKPAAKKTSAKAPGGEKK